MNPMLNIAVRAARDAGKLIVRYVDRTDRLPVITKERNDFVTEVDQKAERQIVTILKQSFPDHGKLADKKETKYSS